MSDAFEVRRYHIFHYVIIKQCEVLEHQHIVPPIDCPFCLAGEKYEEGHKHAISEMSKSQDPSTCAEEHPMWALRQRESVLYPDSRSPDGFCLTDVEPDDLRECSICAEIKAERQRVLEELPQLIDAAEQKYLDANCHERACGCWTEWVKREITAYFAGKE